MTAESEEQKKKWFRFQRAPFDSRKVSRRVKKAERATLRHAHRFIVSRWSNVREVRRTIALWVLSIGILIAATGVQLLWNRAEYLEPAPARDAIYAEAVPGIVDNLNPMYASSSAEDAVARLVFSRLMQYDTKGQLNYDLAKGVAVSEGGKVYTVTLRDDVWWHDGAKLTAQDVMFTIALLRNPATRSIVTDWVDTSIKVELVDEYTVKFILPTTYAAFEHALATFSILPEHILKTIDASAIRENPYSVTPIGSGPFMVKLLQDEGDADAERKVVYLSRNDRYYNGQAKLQRLQIHAYPDEESILVALETNEVNAAAGLSYEAAQRVNKDMYAIDTQPTQGGVYAFFNTESALLSNKDIRRALQVGTDTQAVRDAIGPGIPAIELPFTDAQIGADVPKVPAYNIEAAKKILDDAGWILEGNVRKKDGAELRLNVVTAKEVEYERVIENLTGQWRKLGVILDARIVDPRDPSENFVQSVVQQRNYDVLLYNIFIGRDPDVYAYWHSSQATARGLNLSNYADSTSDDALVSARSRLENDLRNAKYVSFARQWVADAPALGLYQTSALYARSNSTVSFTDETTLVSAGDRYSSALYWSVGERLVYKTP